MKINEFVNWSKRVFASRADALNLKALATTGNECRFLSGVNVSKLFTGPKFFNKGEFLLYNLDLASNLNQGDKYKHGNLSNKLFVQTWQPSHLYKTTVQFQILYHCIIARRHFAPPPARNVPLRTLTNKSVIFSSI